MQIHMPFIADGMHILWRGQGSGLCWVIIDTKFVNDKSVLHPISSSLMKDDVLQILRAKFIDGSRMEFTQRDTHLNPASGRQIAHQLAHRQRISERSRKLGHLQALTRGRKHDRRQISCCNRLWCETPEVEISSRDFRETVAEVYDPDLGLPSAASLRPPLQAERIWGCEEGLRVHWKTRV